MAFCHMHTVKRDFYKIEEQGRIMSNGKCYICQKSTVHSADLKRKEALEELHSLSPSNRKELSTINRRVRGGCTAHTEKNRYTAQVNDLWFDHETSQYTRQELDYMRQAKQAYRANFKRDCGYAYYGPFNQDGTRVYH